MNGPFPAGTSDIQIYWKEDGLMSKIPTEKWVIGGMTQISIHNMYDSPMVKTFKKRAQNYHEAFNGQIKDFSILDK
jgi:hypothetical protein